MRNVVVGSAAHLDALIHKWEAPDLPDNILLDLACGTGSLSEEFAKRGWDVIGIDNSEDMLNEALDKKAESGLPIQYLNYMKGAVTGTLMQQMKNFRPR